MGGWSDEFLAFLAGRAAEPAFLLRVVGSDEIADAPGDATLELASHARYGPALIAGPPRMGEARVSPVSWSATIAAWSLPLRVPDEYHEAIVEGLPRGTVVELLAGKLGWDADSFQRIAIGQVQDVEGWGPGLVLRCVDAQGLLAKRVSTVASDVDLFKNTGNSTTLASAYTPGDSTLDVSVAATFERESSGVGVVKVQGDSGSLFYLTYTGVSGNTLTGVSATGQYGTTAEAASVGNLVYNVALLRGHPLTIAGRALLSGGTAGTPWNVYPATWGYGLPERLVDLDDLVDWRTALAVASGTYLWELLVDAPKGDAWREFWSDAFARGGVWLVTRQGQLAFRAAQTPEDAAIWSGWTIDESAVVAVQSLQRWDQSRAASAREVKIRTYDAAAGAESTLSWLISSTLDRSGLPAERLLEYDLSDVVWTNNDAVEDEVAARLARWVHVIPERLRLVLRGLHWAGLVPGDVVALDLPRLRGRVEGKTAGGFAGVRALVTAVAPDWERWTTGVELLVVAESPSVSIGRT